MAIIGLEVDGPAGRLASVAVQALIYIGLIRLLVVDTGALSWRAMGIRRPDGAALRELAGGAIWAAPVILITIPVAALLSALFPVTPVSPLPPAGETTGFLDQPAGGRDRRPCRGGDPVPRLRDDAPGPRTLDRGAPWFAERCSSPSPTC